MKYIYKLSQDLDVGTGTYDSMVIIADSEKEAILLSYEEAGFFEKSKPNHVFYAPLETPFKDYHYIIPSYGGWASEKDIKIKCIGRANGEMLKSEVICASYNEY